MRFALTDTSPAMLAYHFQVSWSRMRGRAAGPALGLPGVQVEATQMQRALRPGSAVGHSAILRAFATHSIWPHQRLCDVGNVGLSAVRLSCG